MIEIALNDIHKYYGANHILRGLTMEVRQGERLAMLGGNGTGKSTLLKIIAGIEGLDEGGRIIRKDAAIGYLDQIPSYAEDSSVGEILYSAFRDVLSIRSEMLRLEAIMTVNASPEMLENYGELQQLFESRNGYAVDERVSRVCAGLKVPANWYSRSFNSLSGGEQTRIQLAKLMLESPEILLLDEPTNHLDLNSLEWLEGFLADYPGTVLLISHDRYFLDRIAGRVVELEDGKVESYPGNFTAFIREKELRSEAYQRRYENEQRKIDRLETSAKRLHEWARNADNPKMHRQAFSIEKRIERMETIDKPKESRHMRNAFNNASFSGQDVIVVKRMCKTHQGKPVLRNLDLCVRQKEKIAVIGENGSGKSTLLQVIIGEIPPDSGEIRLGESIRWAYLPQTVTFPNPAATILETLSLELREHETQIRRWLAKFNFHQNDVHKRVHDLSGGEKTRLKLCILMHQKLNLLILDEPTNHLDVYSREWLEEALAGFGGTILFVSHDRYFINRFATRIVELTQGKSVEYDGDYQDYLAHKNTAPPENSRKPEKEQANKGRKTVPIRNLSGKNQLEEELIRWENRLAEIDHEMEQWGNDYEKLFPLTVEREEVESEISRLYAEWYSE